MIELEFGGKTGEPGEKPKHSPHMTPGQIQATLVRGERHCAIPPPDLVRFHQNT